MSVVGIIFSNIHDKSIPELTKSRTMASVPFGGRYRLIDFTLSNMVNSGISHVGVITHYNYQSLMAHIGTGKDWDLARRTGGIKILPPYITAFANNANALYSTRLEALISIRQFISECTEDYVVLSDCNVVCNIDLSEIINYHISNSADITIAVKNRYITGGFPGSRDRSTRQHTIIDSDDTGRITDIAECTGDNISGYKDVNINIWVMRRKYLEEMILESIAHGYTNIVSDIVAKNVNKADYRVFKYDKYFAEVNSLSDYFSCNMDLLNPIFRREMFGNKDRQIYTKVHNSAPTVYKAGAAVRNSFIASGCIIEGEVENCILSRGVKISRGSKVNSCILMADSLVGENASLTYVISDKNTVFRDSCVLSGAETVPIFIDKGKIV